jgi:hypothetical protein
VKTRKESTSNRRQYQGHDADEQMQCTGDSRSGGRWSPSI